MSMAAFHALAHPVRAAVVLPLFGRLLLALVGLGALPAAVAAGMGDWDFAARCAAMTLLCLGAGWRLSRAALPSEVRGNEALVVVALIFLAAALLMTWPFMAAGIAPLDALFEAVSGITTTGLSTVGPVADRPAAFLFARAWMQWYGGLAIVALAVGYTIGAGPTARRLSGIERPAEDIAVSTHIWARRVLVIFAVLTAIGIVVLLPFGLPLIDTVSHVLAAVSTGGFSTRDGSIAALGGWPVQAVLLVLGLGGAISFTLYDRIWRRDRRSVLSDVEVRALIAAILLSSLLVAAAQVIFAGRSWTDAVSLAPLLALSAQTTTGFAPADVGALDPASKLILIVSMFIGGDSGSTAGGIKIVRLLLLLRLVQLLLLRATLPRGAVLELDIRGRRIAPDDALTMVGIVLLYGVVVLVSWGCFLLAGAAPLDALFDVVSALSTTGLSTGVTAPGLSPGLKGLLCADMLMGRLEIVALLVLVYPRTWWEHGSRKP